MNIRTLTDADFPAFTATLGPAFLWQDTPALRAREKLVWEADRAHGVFDGEQLVGTGLIATKRLTVPGGPVPVAAVTSISTAPGHRRRGVLSMVMREQLHGLHGTGEPIAALWASEGAIYGRFGYGLASWVNRMRVAKGAAFRPGVDLGEQPVRELSREAAKPLMRRVYDKLAPTRVGMLDRSDGAWEYQFCDDEERRADMSPLRFAVLDDGYAAYRTKQGWDERGPSGRVAIRELVAATPTAYAALVRYLLDIDLVGEIEFFSAVDEPLVHLLVNPDAAVKAAMAAMWVRLVDVDRAIAARRYGAPVDTVVELTDPLCPWNAGRWRLHVDDDGAGTATRTEQPVDLAMDVADLGAAYLGGTRLTTLAAAGRVDERTPGALGALTRAMLGEQEPYCWEVF